MLGHAEAIESRLRAAEADFHAYAAGQSGSLRIGIYQSVANKVLPEVMRRFKERWPAVDVRVTEAAHDRELVDAVERGELDLSFAIQPIPDGPFEVRELMQDPYVLVTGAGSALTRRRPSAGDLAGLPMVGYQHGTNQDHAEEFLLGQGVRPRVVFRSNDNGTVQAMVGAGLGFALAPLLAERVLGVELQIAAGAFATQPLFPELILEFHRRIAGDLCPVWHRDRYRPPAAAAFVETAIAVASEIESAHSVFLAWSLISLLRPGLQTRARSRRPRRPASRPT